MFDTCDTTVVVGVIGALNGFTITKTLADGKQEFGAEAEAVVRTFSYKGSPKDPRAIYLLTDQDIGCTFRDELFIGRDVHVCSTTEAVDVARIMHALHHDLVGIGPK